MRSCCINLKNSNDESSAAAAAAKKTTRHKNDNKHLKMTPSDFRNSINQLLKDIDDFNLSDDRIIESLEALELSKQHRAKIVEIKNGPDDYTILHLAAKQCRAKLCSVLINDYKIGIIIHTCFSKKLFLLKLIN